MESPELPNETITPGEDEHFQFLQNVSIVAVPTLNKEGKPDLTAALSTTLRLQKLFGDGLRIWAGEGGIIQFAATPEAYSRIEEKEAKRVLGELAALGASGSREANEPDKQLGGVAATTKKEA